MTAPKPGDRVDVTFRAVVVDWPGGKSSAVIRVITDATGFPPSFLFPCDTPVSVEVLPPPEPDWQPGDVVGITYPDAPDRPETYLHLGNSHWINITPDSRGKIGSPFRRKHPLSDYPVTLLLRGGKQVQP